MKEKSVQEREFALARIIHLGLLAAVLAYVPVVELFLSRAQVPPNPTFVDLRYYFFAAAVLILVLLRQLRGRPGKRMPPLSASVFISALCEVPAILGLVHAILSGTRRDFYYLAGLSVIFFLLHFPAAEIWESREAARKENER
jgi:hypothetical protein